MEKAKIAGLTMVFILAAGLIQACSLPGWGGGSGITAEELQFTQIAMTVIALQQDDGGVETGDDVDAPVQSMDEPAVATNTQTLIPSMTLTPTITQTPTLDTPVVTVSVDTNCRTGPGKVYDYIGALLNGESAEVVGVSMDGQYWIIKNPDQNGECWLWGNYASVMGSTDGLPKFTPPPTPTPAFIWDGTWTMYNGDPGGPFDVYAMTLTVNGSTMTGQVYEGGVWTADLNGTVSDNLLAAYGSWASNTSTGSFEFFALGSNQFQGNGINNTNPNNVYAWCGGRNGAGQPSPCLKN
ncbi:hypothetical protein KQH56_02360 [bacterium]|nr:hypothetical protein [bacterium]